MGSHISLVEVIGLGLATAIVHQQRSKLQILRQSAKFNALDFGSKTLVIVACRLATMVYR